MALRVVPVPQEDYPCPSTVPNKRDSVNPASATPEMILSSIAPFIRTLSLFGLLSCQAFAADVAHKDIQDNREVAPTAAEPAVTPSISQLEAVPETTVSAKGGSAPTAIENASSASTDPEPSAPVLVAPEEADTVPTAPSLPNSEPVTAAQAPVDAVVEKEPVLPKTRTRAPAKNVDLKEIVETKPKPTQESKAEQVGLPPVPGAQGREGSMENVRSSASAEGGTEGAADTEEEEGEAKQPPLVLLNSEVLPGTAARLEWSPSVSFMGISAPTTVLVVNGVESGPTLCLTAAVHGDELNGIEIVRRVMYNIEPEDLSGAVIGVPIVNLEGFRASSRYLSDRRDLNRYFPGNPAGSSASRIAYSFYHEVVSHCDMLIDLHTGSFRRTNLPQLRADLSYPAVEKLSRKMGAIVVVQSIGAKGSLRRAATEGGVPTVTLEAGAPHELQKSAVETGVKSVETALDGLGLIDRLRFWERAVEPVYYKSTWVRSREGGILISEVALGQNVRQGQLLGAVTDPITNQRHEIVSSFSGRVIGMALNQVMHPGFAAYHIGINADDALVIERQEVAGEGGEATLNESAVSGVLPPVQSDIGDELEYDDGQDDMPPSFDESADESDE
jgi:predicted deacylase